MEKRAKSEQFRKRRNNYFQRGYETGLVCDTDVFVLLKRNGKFYSFTNMKELPADEDIQRNLVLSKTAADYETTSRAKNKASKANTTTSRPRPSNVSENVSTFPTLEIKTPEIPQLDLSSHLSKEFITSLIR